jgi:Spx/MgsR family transcriptional regulator
MSTIIYGITTCDTVRKARKWLDAEAIEAHYHDLRKDGLSADQLEHWLSQQPLDILLNRRGTSWRKLPEADKASEDEAHLKALILAQPTLLKRPIIEHKGQVTVGFKADVQAAIKSA